MAEKQTDADKAAALKEYRDQQTAAVDRIAALRAARLARDLEAPPPAAKAKKKAVAGKTSPKAVLLKAVASKFGATKPVAKPASKTASKKVAAKVTAKV